MGSIFVTLSTLAYATFAPEHTNAAAGLCNLPRSLGRSVASIELLR